jgi:hypothetical protein
LITKTGNNGSRTGNAMTHLLRARNCSISLCP